MKFAFVFPGQGSQMVGMMTAYGEHPVLRATFDEASSALGRDLWQLAQMGPSEAQNQTVNTQPLMLTAGIAVWRLWRELGGAQPAMVAGHSLGEYSALVAAEVLSLAEAVPLVEFRAQAMQKAVPEGTGAMAAILGLDAATVATCCAQAALQEIVQAVNFNAPEQTVIAGHYAAVERAMQLCKAQGAKRAVLLPVSAPFHCALMQPAAEKLQGRLAQLELRIPKIPLINNVAAAVLTVPQAIRTSLGQQAAAPVRWVDTLRAMQAASIAHIYECGPGKVLTGLVKRCVDNVGATALDSRTNLDLALQAQHS